MQLGVGAIVFERCVGNYPNSHGVPEEAVTRLRETMEVLTVESVLASLTPAEQRAREMARRGGGMEGVGGPALQPGPPNSSATVRFPG